MPLRQGFTLKCYTSPAMFNEITNIGMVTPIGMLQNIFTVIATKTGQRLLFIQTVQLGESENLAGSLVGSRLIYRSLISQPIFKPSGRVVISSGNGFHDLFKFYALGIIFQLLNELLNGHLCSLSCYLA